MSNHAQQNLLHAYLDRELDLVRSMELEHHLAECSDCAREVASFRALQESVIGADLRYRAPADFRARLLSELQQAQQPQTRPEPTIVRRSIPWWSWAAVAACLLLAAGAFLVDTNRRAERTLATQIVADLEAIEELGVIPVLGDYLDHGMVARHATDRIATDLMELATQTQPERA